ncbi:MAG TPA: DNA repair protein RadC [Lachnospiraceae bacterium]|nr:DNA repair protein RadC [Lachnospiraceae bacterium]
MKELLTRENADFDRPYERCLLYGPAALTDAQLLAVIIKTGTKGYPAIRLAEKILDLSKEQKGLLGICHLTIPELMTIPGIGEVKAIQLKCVGELSKRLATYKARNVLSFSDPCSIAEYYMEQLRHDEKESLIAMMLDTKNHLIGEECVSKGTVNSTVLSSRELFLSAMRYRAVSIILVHNHPSGDPTPSHEDKCMTKKIYEAGELLEIHLLDHIVIGDRCYISFSESGLLHSGGKNDHQ